MQRQITMMVAQFLAILGRCCFRMSLARLPSGTGLRSQPRAGSGPGRYRAARAAGRCSPAGRRHRPSPSIPPRWSGC